MLVSNKRLIWILLGAFLALVPEYLIRSNLDTAYFLYNHFTTYFGDLWYCFDIYWSHNFTYPREYPSGIQLLFRILYLIPEVRTNYTLYMATICSILSICALAITYILYKLVCKTHGDTSKVWLLWILAPSYLFYGLINLDFLVILPMLLSYYSFTNNRNIQSGIWLAIGTTIKVFPIFILPVLFFSTNRKKQLAISFILTWLILNIPFMVSDFGAWNFPYLWQIQENFAKTSNDYSWTWIIYQIFDHFGIGILSGKVSLLLFAIGYVYFCLIKYKNLPLIQKIAGIMLLFLLTDRCYSAQYNLYLLPFLVLVNYKINRKYFYLLEIPNVLLILFCFYIKSHIFILQGLMAIKYFALIMLFNDNWVHKDYEFRLRISQ